MQLISSAIPLFLILQLSMIGRAAPTEDPIRHCTCHTLLQLHELIIHLLKGDQGDDGILVSPSDEYLRPYLKRETIPQPNCTSLVRRSPFKI